MTKGLFLTIISLSLLILDLRAAQASQMIEKIDRLEINWSTMRVRFYGEAKMEAGSDESYKEVEKRAWNDGLKYISGAVRDIYINKNEALFEDAQTLSESAAKAAEKVATSTFSYDTTYYGDGAIRVHLENTLPRALASEAIRFRLKVALEPGLIQHSGILFQLNKEAKPLAVYRIVNNNGQVLFDATEMAESSFKKNLMGRWFKAPKSHELTTAVGAAPVKIPLTILNDGVFEVDAKTWEKALEGHKSLLRSGRIALTVP